jgi:Fanconi anemia group M protein
MEVSPVSLENEGFFEHPKIPNERILRREYQIRISTKALGKPTLVVLPTGLGKTVIALIVIAERLKQRTGPILMMAPTKPLVEQHRSFLESNLKDESVEMLTGEVPPAKRKEVYGRSNILVSTPQVIKNDLISGDLDPSLFKTIVFDESHRAVGEYPYVFIAEQLLRVDQEILTLGLTASPGHDVSRIYEVCKNLGMENIEVRVDTDEDVKPYIQELDVQRVKVEVSQGMRGLISILERMFNDRVGKLQRIGAVKKGQRTSVKEILSAGSRIREMIARSGRDAGHLYQAMSVQAQAMKIAHALELAETQGAEALYQYLDRLLKETSNSDCSKATKSVVSDPLFETALNKASALRLEQPPKLDAMMRFILQKFREEPSSRIIAFTHFRDTASLVYQRLEEERNRGIHPVRFVGQSNRENDHGLNQKQQKELLEKFRKGEYNVLVATSVAEEGLDIPGADLVIFYEPIPSEIRTIQRRGRTGRHSSGKVIVLMSKETRDIAYSFSARDKELRMERQLLALRRMLARKPMPKKKIEKAAAKPSPATLDSFSKEENEGPSKAKIIYADQREMPSGVVEELVRAGIKVKPLPLDEGDYRISDRVVVERKTVQDLSDSIIDGRLFEQAVRLRDEYERPIFLVEGDTIYNKRNISRNAVLGALASLTSDYGIPTMFTRDAKETAEFIIALLRREEKTGKNVRSGQTPRSKDIDDIQIRILSGLPGISTMLAERILEHFGSLESVFSAEETDLSEIEGIGKKKAKEIRSVIKRNIF